MISWIVAVLAWLTAHGFDPQTLIAGFLGGLVRSVVSRTGTVVEKLAGGFSGCAFAVYFGATVATFTGIPYPTGCFVAGMLGIYAAETAVKIAKHYVKEPGAIREFLIKMLTKK